MDMETPADYYNAEADGGYNDNIHGTTETMSNFDSEYEEFIYPGYSFERTVYTYIWGILVTITFLANILVISVLLRKKMRNPTNMILAAIAVSDSLTGLVTLPTYWMVYSKSLMSDMNYDFYDYSETTSVPFNNQTTTAPVQQNVTMPLENYDYENSMYPENISSYNDSYEVRDGYELSQNLCRGFMISKYFLSKTFHTISIWMTLFLGFQRFISVAIPFRAQKWFTELNVIITCVVIAVLAPILHVYHLVDEKADTSHGMCEWNIEDGCGPGCAYLVTAFLLRHFIPCLLLTIFTVLFITQLAKSSSRINRSDSMRGNAAMKHRDVENRRVSLIVTLIVIVFLIPEVPHGSFLLYALFGRLTKAELDLETNRAIHLVYELYLVLSFHANFYIFTFFNRRFRKGLLKGVVFPVFTCCGNVPWFRNKFRSSLTKSSISTSERRRTVPNESEAEMKMMSLKR